MADPEFGKELAASADRALVHKSQSSGESSPSGGLLTGAYFPPLVGTAEEGNALKSILPEAQLLTGKEATKAALKSAHGPAILHIATHGFFLEDAPAPPPESRGMIMDTERLLHHTSAAGQQLRVENPLLRSGLALAGANEHKAADNGILTALETAGLSLWGTELVVLSACDTGVGEVKNGDGVYGLRRALVLAGSASQMMSLWPVSDGGTRELMVMYYQALQAGKGRSEALRQVQLQMLKDPKRQHPYYWASFIQSGQWAPLTTTAKKK